ncbi:hypothetical protein [Streptosporangium sp. NPDC048865]|uniref:hypothetical protein n=1 Tax=Streptosporangium sp. NPDC048865 TaxID=3155766 RepID=UPI0034384D9C
MHAIRDRLVATPCGAANLYLVAGYDQRKTQQDLECARIGAEQAARMHDRRGDDLSERRLQRAVQDWKAARQANRDLNIRMLNAQTIALREAPDAAARVNRELVAMWAEYDARRGVPVDA